MPTSGILLPNSLSHADKHIGCSFWPLLTTKLSLNLAKLTKLMLSQASPAPPYLKRGSHAKPPSPPNPTLKPSYSQIVKTRIPPRDREKQAHDPGNLSRAPSHDPPTPIRSPDIIRDQMQSHVPMRPHDPTHFGRATCPLINMWQTVGTNQWSMRSSRSQGIPQGIPHSLSPMDTGTSNTLIGLRA